MDWSLEWRISIEHVVVGKKSIHSVNFVNACRLSSVQFTGILMYCTAVISVMDVDRNDHLCEAGSDHIVAWRIVVDVIS